MRGTIFWLGDFMRNCGDLEQFLCEFLGFIIFGKIFKQTKLEKLSGPQVDIDDEDFDRNHEHFGKNIEGNIFQVMQK